MAESESSGGLIAAQGFLAAAQLGTSLLDAHYSRQVARERRQAQTEMAGFQADAQRAQLRRASEQDARQRTRRLSATLGRQEQALGAAGVAGGRTARLLRSRAQYEALHERGRSEMAQLTQRQAIEAGAQSARAGARAQEKATRAQSRVDTTASVLRASGTGLRLWERYQAEQGEG